MSAPPTAAAPLTTSWKDSRDRSRGKGGNQDPSDINTAEYHRTEYTEGFLRGKNSSVSLHLNTIDSTAHRHVIGNYELGRILATGDFDCRTRLCTHIGTGVQYVVRVYDKRVLAETKWMWDRVAESIRVQRTLPKNKHVLEMIECFESNTSIYIVMHMFLSTNVTQLFTDATARAKFLCHLQSISRAAPRSSAVSNSTCASKYESENTENDTHHPASIQGHALQTTDTMGISTRQESSLTTPLATNTLKRVSSRRLEKGMCTSTAPPADSQSFGQGADETADANDRSLRGAEKGPSITSAAARTKGGARASLTAMAAANALGGTVLPSHVPLTLIRVLFEQAVKGVLHLHQHNVAHTGIAPDHLLVGPDGLLRVSSMVSCCFCAPGGRLHDLRGTRHTVPPEVLRGESYDPHLADAWALGVVLYFMLNRGRYPHDGASTLRHILHGHTRPARPGLPPVALDLVARLMQASPEERLPVYAILAHPFFSVDLPTIAEELATDAAEAAELQAQPRHRCPTSSAAALHTDTAGNKGNGCNERQWRGCNTVVDASRGGLTSLQKDSLTSFGSGDSTTCIDEMSSMRLDPHKDIASGEKSCSRWNNTCGTRSPPAGSSTLRFTSELRLPPVSAGRGEPDRTSLVTASLRGGVAVPATTPLRPVWRGGLAPTRKTLEDHAARVIQYHYRQRQCRRRFRAETRALVARSQKKCGANAEEGIGRQPKSPWNHHLPVAPARRGDSISNSSSSSGSKTFGPVESKSLPNRPRPGAAPAASASKCVRSTDASGVVAHTLADSHKSVDDDDDNIEGSFISGLDVAPRESIAGSSSTVASSASVAETNGTAVREPPIIPPVLPALTHCSLRSRAQARNSASCNFFAASQRRRGSSNTGALSTSMSPRNLDSCVGRTADGMRAVEGMVKDGEPCPLCCRKPYRVRSIGLSPYPDTPYLYVKGDFTKMLSA
ncbi:hypothetical protein JKF63_04437 [Porcisia hertigi]|uniref:Protein kinase domain-containing protein n=1 Tax=Porcisia hertigi TaxID=2761500 RepID=A0A836IIC4_9TRYP|nr:hypothetical protein JKF63_04437 [Porcisia hertigi]